MAVAGCYLFLTTIEGQIFQPILVGRRLDVSPLIVILCLWFGGWLWGVAGVALAMPLVVTAKAFAIELAMQDAAAGSQAWNTPARTATPRAPARLTDGARSGVMPPIANTGRPADRAASASSSVPVADITPRFDGVSNTGPKNR